MRDWRDSELKRKRNESSNVKEVKELPEKKRGHQLLLGEELDKQVHASIF